jgi:predicted enzyme related to lactoylglutathione lyase
MIYLEHLNLVVRDIPTTVNFYQAAFPHWRIREEGGGEWSGKPRKWLHLGDDYQYLTLNDNGVGENRDLSDHQTGLAHFGFVTENLDALVSRLTDAGYALSHNGVDEPYRRNAYFVDPSGFEVEFVQYLSDIPQERNLSN